MNLPLDYFDDEPSAVERVAKGELDAMDRGDTTGGSEKPEWEGEAIPAGPQAGIETQIPDHEVIGLTLHDRPGFLRYLQSEFNERPLSIAAKLDRLAFIERVAKQQGVPVDHEYFDGLRTIIKKRGL